MNDYLKDKDPRALARIVAHLMGDGNVCKRYLRYNNKEIELLRDFERDFLKLFPETHFIRGKYPSGVLFTQVQGKEKLTFFHTLCPSYKSGDIRLPSFINEKEHKCEFLGGLFDDEGCVALRVFYRTEEIKRNLDISSKSEDILKDLKYFLEQILMIKCNKIISYSKNSNDRTFTIYKLSITGKDNIARFRDLIRIVHPEKIRKLDMMIKSYIR